MIWQIWKRKVLKAAGFAVQYAWNFHSVKPIVKTLRRLIGLSSFLHTPSCYGLLSGQRLETDFWII